MVGIGFCKDCEIRIFKDEIYQETKEGLLCFHCKDGRYFIKLRNRIAVKSSGKLLVDLAKEDR